MIDQRQGTRRGARRPTSAQPPSREVLGDTIRRAHEALRLFAMWRDGEYHHEGRELLWWGDCSRHSGLLDRLSHNDADLLREVLEDFEFDGGVDISQWDSFREDVDALELEAQRIVDLLWLEYTRDEQASNQELRERNCRPYDSTKDEFVAGLYLAAMLYEENSLHGEENSLPDSLDDSPYWSLFRDAVVEREWLPGRVLYSSTCGLSNTLFHWAVESPPPTPPGTPLVKYDCPSCGPQHRLDGREVHCGSVLEVEISGPGSWVEARYEWAGDGPDSAVWYILAEEAEIFGLDHTPCTHPPGSELTVVRCQPHQLVRWPEDTF